MSTTIDVVLPAHNEGESIGLTLREFYQIVATDQGHSIRFIVCEDGSKDNTVAVIQETAKTLPVILISENFRKGYSRAVIDGFKASTNSLVGFIDSDGQCDPRDFAALYSEMMEKDCDLVVCYRNPRKDHWTRLLMSGLFKQVYQLYFDVGLKDPSCPYLIIKRDALLRLLKGNVGILKQGFWWEFFARARACKLSICQVPVTHRIRTAGKTIVYRPTKISGSAWQHLRGLAKLSRELKSS